MRERSIRRTLLYMTGMMQLLFILFIGTLVVNNHLCVTQYKEMVSLQGRYESLGDGFVNLQDKVNLYYNRLDDVDRHEVEEVLLCQEECVQTILESFDHPQFVDFQYIFGAYARSVRGFLEEMEHEEERGLPSGFRKEWFEQDRVKEWEKLKGDHMDWEEWVEAYPMGGLEGDAASGADLPYEMVDRTYVHTIDMYLLTLSSLASTASPMEDFVTEKIQKVGNAWGTVEGIILICGVGIMLLTIYKSLKIVVRITKPLEVLTDCAYKIMQGNNEGAVPMLSTEKTPLQETAVLGRAFEEMNTTIQRQMEELQEKMGLELEHMQTKIALSQTETFLMQSLISPHFLFNCLNTLTSLSVLEGAERTEECSILLARFLRAFLDRIGKKVEVFEEVRLTQQYIEIQRMRFGERIHFEIAFDESVGSQVVPALILQPLVENAISHGLKGKAEGGVVAISVRRDGTGLCMEVRDNGKGLDEETARVIQEQMRVPFKPGERGIGLRSVFIRLRDCFGEAAWLTLEPWEEGAVARIWIPM